MELTRRIPWPRIFAEGVVIVVSGLEQRSAVNLERVQTVDKDRLEWFVGSVSPRTMAAVCAALAIATGYD